MGTVLIILTFLVVLGVGCAGVAGAVTWARSGARAIKAENRKLRTINTRAENALQAIANGSADPTNEASIALWDIEQKELEK